MKLHCFLAATLLLSPSLVFAALFPSDTQVKIIDANGFKKAMKQNSTSVVAFVAPWCGHCQRMAPEYHKAANSLSPMVPLYAVDCDQESNKRLCAEQGVQGFPTVKLYPRGGRSKPVDFDGGQRTAKIFFNWASRNIPLEVKRLDKVEDVPGWLDKHVSKPRALLLNVGSDIPLIWKSLGNKYKGHVDFAILRDQTGKHAVEMGVDETEKKGSKILVYPAGSSEFVRFESTMKFDPLDKYLKSIVKGTAEFPKSKSKERTSAENESVAVHTAKPSPSTSVVNSTPGMSIPEQGSDHEVPISPEHESKDEPAAEPTATDESDRSVSSSPAEIDRNGGMKDQTHAKDEL